MARTRDVDPSTHLARVAEALAQPEQPRALFQALDRAMGATLGHRLFTVLRYHPDAQESERLYTSQGAAYPVGGRKTVRPSSGRRRPLHASSASAGRTSAARRPTSARASRTPS